MSELRKKTDIIYTKKNFFNGIKSSFINSKHLRKG